MADGLGIQDIAKKHGVSINYIQKQIDKGQEVEQEHTDDSKMAKKIAMGHEVEIPDYYTRLNGMENEYRNT